MTTPIPIFVFKTQRNTCRACRAFKPEDSGHQMCDPCRLILDIGRTLRGGEVCARGLSPAELAEREARIRRYTLLASLCLPLFDDGPARPGKGVA